MMRPMLGAAVAAVLLAACGGGTGPTVSNPSSSASATSSAGATSSAPSSSDSSSSSPSPTSTGIASSIKTGQCLTDTTSYQVVPCTQTHIYQVTAVIQDVREKGNPTARQVLRAETCNASLSKFTGGAPVGLLAVPSPVALVDDPLNAGRIVCLVHLRTDGDVSNLPINYTLQGKLAGKAAFNYTFCVDKVAKGFNIVRCSAAHAGQSVGGYLSGRYTEKYPGRARLVAQRAQNCPALGQAFLGTTTRTDVVVDGLFVTEAAWKQGDRYAACFVKVKSGTVKKSMQGIGKTPLTAYR